MKKTLFFLLLSLSVLYSQQGLEPNTKYHLVRMDDFGMCHSVNMAVKKVIESGLPSSVSIMFVCSWYQEAIDILKEYPEVSVGVHLTLNAEWKNYRWGPISGKDAVSSLVDSVGYFFPSRAKLYGNNPQLDEIEKELRAQLDRAMNSGISIDYMDFHMGAAVETEATRTLVENLAEEYGLAISMYFGEKYSNDTYGAQLGEKKKALTTVINELEPGINLQVTHVGFDTPELAAMKDMNSFGLENMSKHREGEMNSLLSEEFRNALKENKVKSITYRELIKLVGLNSKQRPKAEE